jgi:hypothetical protein
MIEGNIQVKERALAALIDLQKEVTDIRRRCSMSGRNFNEDTQGMTAALMFRQSLSLLRLVLNDNKFFDDEISEI